MSDGEDDELLRFQDAFLQSGKAPAAKVVRRKRPDEQSAEDVASSKKRKVEDEGVIPGLSVGDIVERDERQFSFAPPRVPAAAFPAAVHRSVRGFGRRQGKAVVPAAQKEDPGEIHRESEAKLQSMSEAEIREAKAMLQNTLNPSLLENLKRRGREKAQARQNEAAVEMEEEDKLAWMRDDVEVEEPAVALDRYADVRFDFEGKTAEDAEAGSGLYHHGREADKAGYTLEEMFMLIRSQVPSQRTLNLQSFSSLMERVDRGLERDFSSVPLRVHLVKDMGVAGVLRVSIDDHNLNVLLQAVLALHALLVIPQDEVLLEEYQLFYRGHEVTPLHALFSENLEEFLVPDDTNDDEDGSGPSDSAVIKHDLIR